MIPNIIDFKGFNATAEAEETEWAKGLPERKGNAPVLGGRTTNLDFLSFDEKTCDEIDERFIRNLKNK